MQNYNKSSSYNMQSIDKQYEYVIKKITEIYNFNFEDYDQLLQFRELIKNIILMYEKAQDMSDTNISEQ